MNADAGEDVISDNTAECFASFFKTKGDYIRVFTAIAPSLDIPHITSVSFDVFSTARLFRKLSRSDADCAQ